MPAGSRILHHLRSQARTGESAPGTIAAQDHLLIAGNRTKVLSVADELIHEFAALLIRSPSAGRRSVRIHCAVLDRWRRHENWPAKSSHFISDQCDILSPFRRM